MTHRHSKPEDLFRLEKERAQSSRNSQHARLLAEAKAAFDKLMAEGQAARKSGRPRKHPLPPLKTSSSRVPPRPPQAAAIPARPATAAPAAAPAPMAPRAAPAAAKTTVKANVTKGKPAKAVAKKKVVKSLPRKTASKTKKRGKR